jgi:3'-phosphoadenosine 5'-phosphosulfate sulfotransferase (PAPS reductase)/FAD synthetase
MTLGADRLFDDRPTPEAIIADALENAGGPVIRTVCLFSGGGDSIVVAHRCRDLYDELAHIDTGTALPGVREHVERIARELDKPLRILENGPDVYRRLVLGDEVWWRRFRAAAIREGDLTIATFVRREAGTRKPGDGLGNAPLGFPGPGGGHRAAYARLKERQVERLVRDTKAELGASRRARVALLSGARLGESRRRRVTNADGPYRLRKAQLWINPVHWWTNEEMRAYRREHRIAVSDVAALLHRSGECNCGSYIGKDERADLEALFPDWVDAVIRPLEAEARDLGVPRCVWGERLDTGRAGARGAIEEVDDAPLCSDCQLSLEAQEV